MYELRDVESLNMELEEQRKKDHDVVQKKKKRMHSNVGHIDKKMMIKSESNDSLTSATSYDDSVSSIEDHGVAIGGAVADK